MFRKNRAASVALTVPSATGAFPLDHEYIKADDYQIYPV